MRFGSSARLEHRRCGGGKGPLRGTETLIRRRLRRTPPHKLRLHPKRDSTMECVSEARPRRGRARCERWGIMHCCECRRRECRKAAVRSVAVVRSDLPIKVRQYSSMKTLKNVRFHDIYISMCLLGLCEASEESAPRVTGVACEQSLRRDARFLVTFLPWPSRCHQQLTAQEAWLPDCFQALYLQFSPRGHEVWASRPPIHVTSLV